MLNLIKTNHKNLQIDFVINRFKLYFSNNLLSKYIHIILIYLNNLENSSKMIQKKIYSPDDVFSCILRVF